MKADFRVLVSTPGQGLAEHYAKYYTYGVAGAIIYAAVVPVAYFLILASIRNKLQVTNSLKAESRLRPYKAQGQSEYGLIAYLYGIGDMKRAELHASGVQAIEQHPIIDIYTYIMSGPGSQAVYRIQNDRF